MLVGVGVLTPPSCVVSEAAENVEENAGPDGDIEMQVAPPQSLLGAPMPDPAHMATLPPMGVLSAMAGPPPPQLAAMSALAGGPPVGLVGPRPGMPAMPGGMPGGMPGMPGQLPIAGLRPMLQTASMIPQGKHRRVRRNPSQTHRHGACIMWQQQ